LNDIDRTLGDTYANVFNALEAVHPKSLVIVMVSPSRWKARSNLSTRPCSRFFPGTPRAGLMRKQAMTLASLLDSRFDLTAASPRYEVVFGGGVQGGSARCVESPIGLEGMFRVHEDSGMASLRQQKEAGSPITSSKSFRDPSSRASSPDPPSHSAGGMWTLQWKRTAVSERDCNAKQTSGVRCGEWRLESGPDSTMQKTADWCPEEDSNLHSVATART
jgi:hypothetical protein